MSLPAHHPIDILRFNTCGSVDDGKSTLIGRLLYDSKSLMEDQLEALERSADITGGGQINLANLTDGDFILSLRYKLMGQVNVVRAAMDKVKDGGSTTVTSGILATKPMPGSVAVSQVNSGLKGFVSAAGLDMQRGIRMIGAIIALIRADCRRRDCEAARWACELMGTVSGKRNEVATACVAEWHRAR